MARIIVGSYLVQFPLGGYLSWVGQWLAGFRRLGHDVWFVEKSKGVNSCYDPSADSMTDDSRYGTGIVGRFFKDLGLESKWCFVDSGNAYHGVSRTVIEEAFRSADVFVD